MFQKAMRKAALRFVIVVIALLAILAIAANFDAGNYTSYWQSFKDKLFIGGWIILGIGAFVGGGFSESAYYGNAAYKMSGTYMNAISDGRMERRRQNIAFMIYCVAVGGLLVVLPYVLP